MTIRRATKEDHPDINRLENLIFAGRDELFSAAQLKYLLCSPNSAVFMCFRDGQPAGYGIALVNRLKNRELKGRIYSIGLLPACQNTGMGRELLRELEGYLIGMGVAFITLETRTDQKGAGAFFEKMGYRATAVLSRYYGKCDGVRMVKLIKEGYAGRRSA